jgi:hypothetical protein
MCFDQQVTKWAADCLTLQADDETHSALEAPVQRLIERWQ